MKYSLYIILLANRKLPPSREKTGALNCILAVYRKHPSVIKEWKDYYNLCCQDNPSPQQMEHAYTQLLTEMGKVLKYKEIAQIDLEKFYLPKGLVEAEELQSAVQQGFLKFFEAASTAIQNRESS